MDADTKSGLVADYRRRKTKAMIAAGKPIKAIAKRLGVSRRRIEQILAEDRQSQEVASEYLGTNQ